jgi:hypothetical protein
MLQRPITSHCVLLRAAEPALQWLLYRLIASYARISHAGEQLPRSCRAGRCMSALPSPTRKGPAGTLRTHQLSRR